MKPTIGRIVILKLSDQMSGQINRRRTDSASIAIRIKVNAQVSPAAAWPLGAQAHIGNPANPGDELPMVIVRVWSDSCVNGQVLLDGNDTYWATSVVEGTDQGQWHWPIREE